MSEGKSQTTDSISAYFDFFNCLKKKKKKKKNQNQTHTFNKLFDKRLDEFTLFDIKGKESIPSTISEQRRWNFQIAGEFCCEKYLQYLFYHGYRDHHSQRPLVHKMVGLLWESTARRLISIAISKLKESIAIINSTFP